MKILIGGDLVPTKTNEDMFCDGNVEALFDKKILKLLERVDFRIFNLETPLSNEKAPIVKCGPNFTAKEDCVNAFKKIGVNLFTLANNHIMDQGELGYKNTIEVLHDSGIDYVGVGENIFEASRPYVIKKDGIKIGIYACAEHEFSIATEHSSGANPFDPLESLDHITQLKSQCDYVICLYHGGKENYPYPTPYLQKVCRKIIQKGADIVVCQHSHCIGCEEKYLDGTIVYGQGNFFFDYNNTSELWNTSLLIELDINKEVFSVGYHPIMLGKGKCTLCDATKCEQIICEFIRRGSEIKENSFVKNRFIVEITKMREYYSPLFERKKLSRKFFCWDKKLNGKLSKFFITEENEKLFNICMKSYLNCEVHNEVLSLYFEEKLKGDILKGRVKDD